MQGLFLGLFGVSFALGQLAAVTIAPGVRISALDVATGMLLLYCAFHQKGKRLIPPLWLPIVAFVLIGLVSVFLNRAGVSLWGQGAGLLYLVRYLVYAGLYWAAATSTIKKESWLTTLYTAGIAMALLGFVQFAWYPNLRNLYYLGWDPHYQRLFSTLLDPNFTGIILVCTLLLGMARRVGPVAQIAGFTALMFTYSRSSYIALIAAGIVVAATSKPLRKILGFSAALFLALLILLPKTGEGRNLLREASVSARVENARLGLQLFFRSPIFGFGFNTLRYVSPVTGLVPSHAAAGFDASVIFIIATTGIAGLGVYIWLMVRLIVFSRKEVFLLAALAAIFVHSAFVNSLFYPWVLAVLWIWAGTIRASHAAQPSFDSLQGLLRRPEAYYRRRKAGSHS